MAGSAFPLVRDLHAFAGAPLTFLDIGESDGDWSLSISNPIVLHGYLFLGTLCPGAAFVACGAEPKRDALACQDFPGYE